MMKKLEVYFSLSQSHVVFSRPVIPLKNRKMLKPPPGKVVFALKEKKDSLKTSVQLCISIFKTSIKYFAVNTAGV